MSISNWNDYGYGIRTDNLQIKSEESLGELVSMAPKLKAEMDAYFEEQEISELTMEDYLGYDTEYDYQLASLMRLVIKEAEGIDLIPCDDLNAWNYLLYMPSYPWRMSETDLRLTEEKLDEIFQKYFSVVTDDEISPTYLNLENGD